MTYLQQMAEEIAKAEAYRLGSGYPDWELLSHRLLGDVIYFTFQVLTKEGEVVVIEETYHLDEKRYTF